eukprot:4219608-Prorocentrum_lima.AAC.1
MTSSLVGSEMCIRDRLALAFGSGGHPRKRRQYPSQRVTCSWASALCGWPVSYTHLTLPTICSV